MLQIHNIVSTNVVLVGEFIGMTAANVEPM